MINYFFLELPEARKVEKLVGITAFKGRCVSPVVVDKFRGKLYDSNEMWNVFILFEVLGKSRFFFSSVHILYTFHRLPAARRNGTTEKEPPAREKRSCGTRRRARAKNYRPEYRNGCDFFGYRSFPVRSTRIDGHKSSERLTSEIITRLESI